MKKLLFWMVLIVGIVVLLGSCAKKDDSTTATATATAFTSSTTAAGSITFGSETLSGIYASACLSTGVAAVASAGIWPSDTKAVRDVLVVTSDTSVSEEFHGYSDTSCSNHSFYSKDGDTSFTVGDASGENYKVTYTETSYKALVDTTFAETWWEARLSTGLTVGTEYSSGGSLKNYLNLFSVTSTTVQIGEDDNETYPTAMDSQVMTKQ